MAKAKEGYWRGVFSWKRWIRSLFIAMAIGLAAYLGTIFLNLYWFLALVIVTIILALIPDHITDVIFH